MNKKENQNLISRPPVVVVLGHIDHGKTTLLDNIRKSHVVEKETGGITQHIGAYQVSLSGGKEEKERKITFLDTPGHEAFFQMRSRGAKVADIAVLVIDSSEGVKAQTKEAVSHIKKSKIPLIVALNKIDKPEANTEKVKRELSQEDILLESMGGKIPSVEISALTGKGVNELLDLILLVSDMEELKADLQKEGKGVVIESHLDNLKGATATLLLTEGVLRNGDIIATFSSFGKIKKLEDFQKNPIEQALPSQPVVVFGLNQVPKAGEEFKTFTDLENAKNYPRDREEKNQKVLDISEGQKVLNLILKTDVLGSAEAIEYILKNFPQEKIILRILKSEAGGINESDIKLAQGGRAIILGFRVKIDPIAKKLLEREKIKVMQFEVIYDLVEEIRKLMEKRLEPEQIRIDWGRAKVLAIFLGEKNRQIVGGRVTEGEVKKGALIEIFRNDEKVGQGKLVNLQRNKKEAEAVSKGEECGMLYEGDTKIEQGDILAIYTEEKKKGEL